MADNAGTAIHYAEWGSVRDGRPGLLFIPGYRATLRWWDFLAPVFVDRFHVVVMELSGMGDSGRRTAYHPDDFVRDILGVVAHSGLRRPVGIGHSFGGSRLLRACGDYPDLFERAIVVDSFVHFADEGAITMYPRLGRREPYPTREAAIERFRLSPEQPIAHATLAQYLAAGAVCEVEGGWTWKFDLELPGGGPMELDGAAVLGAVRVPVDLIWGEHSRVVDAPRMKRIAEALPHLRHSIMVPDAHHHVMLDQPIALSCMLQALLD
jgi:pimeloyl-ACP methyl ester carboxylesterase